MIGADRGAWGQIVPLGFPVHILVTTAEMYPSLQTYSFIFILSHFSKVIDDTCQG